MERKHFGKATCKNLLVVLDRRASETLSWEEKSRRGKYTAEESSLLTERQGDNKLRDRSLSMEGGGEDRGLKGILEWLEEWGGSFLLKK